MKREDTGYFYETDKRRVYRLVMPKIGYEAKLKIPGRKKVTARDLKAAGELAYSIYLANLEISGECIEEQSVIEEYGAKAKIELTGDSGIGREYVSVVKEYELT